jgi:hypothetical protein
MSPSRSSCRHAADTLLTRLYWLVAGSARGRTNMNGMPGILEKVKAVIEIAGRSR